MKEVKDRFFHLLYRYISLRMRSEWEVRGYLQKRFSKYPDLSDLEKNQITEELLQYFTEENLINDVVFTESWIATRTALKPKSERVLRMELKQKGISDEIIQSFFIHNPSDELSLATRALSGKMKMLSYETDSKKKYAKAINFLMRRGFTYGIAKKAFEQLTQKE